MSDRFPPLRPQSALNRSESRALAAPVDLTLFAALALVLALALV